MSAKVVCIYVLSNMTLSWSNFNFSFDSRITRSSRECGENYQRILLECPPALFEDDYDDVTLCPEQISQDCRDAMASIEGWYCSCRSELDNASNKTRFWFQPKLALIDNQSS